MKKRLCFGSMFKVLIHCKREEINNEVFVGKFTRTIDPHCEYINRRDAVSELISCDRNLSGKRSNGISNVKTIASDISKEEVAIKIQSVIDEITIPDKRALCLAAIFDIIRNDDYIIGEKRLAFASRLECDRDVLLEKYKKCDIYFSDLLAGLLLYVIVDIKNKNEEQKEFVATIDEKYMSQFEDEAGEINDKVIFNCRFRELVNEKLKSKVRSVYEGIDIIIGYLSKENSKEGYKFGNEYKKPIRVEKKFKEKGSSVERSIVNNVREYYNFIEERFNALDDELDAYFNETWKDVRNLYDEIKKENKTNETIYQEIVELLDMQIPSDAVIRKDAHYLEYIKIIVSFFVQNCAIFKEERKLVDVIS